MPQLARRARLTLPTLLVLGLLVITGGYFGWRMLNGSGELEKAGGAVSGNTSTRTQVDSTAKSPEHPLVPALKLAREIQAHIDQNVRDYTCTFVKRERHNGQVTEAEYVNAKFRNEPFNVYMRFEKPESMEGQEAIYVDGQNNNHLVGRGNGLKRLVGWVSFVPTGPIPMQNNHYPITESGLRNLTKRLIEVAENDLKFGECEVKFLEDLKLNDAVTTCIEVIHPVPRRSFLFHKARIYVDKELKVPIRYEAYDWPTQPGEPPALMEEYTYLNLKLNVGLTDADFTPSTYK